VTEAVPSTTARCHPVSTAVGPVPATRRSGFLTTVKAYLALTKARIIEQLLVVTVPAMMLAERSVPSLWLVLSVLVGGAGAAASAHALNCVVDADIDAKMARTSKRPLARDAVPRSHALVFGLLLGAASAVWLGLTSNWVAAWLAVAAIAFYILVYTLLLKRRTSQNIVWGGAAGCMPVVIGWAAVTGTVGWPALVLFAIIFFWTPPHFWALAMRYRDDYAAAGIPMLPVVASPRRVSRQIVAYSWAMVACSALLVPATSWIYLVATVLGGAWFLIAAHRLDSAVKRDEVVKSMRLFHLSNTYLTGLFVAVAVDSAVGWPVFGWPF
jgi:protoheme IX farnesyltransferase